MMETKSLLVIFFIIASTHSEDSDLTFENESGRKLESHFSEMDRFTLEKNNSVQLKSDASNATKQLEKSADDTVSRYDKTKHGFILHRFERELYYDEDTADDLTSGSGSAFAPADRFSPDDEHTIRITFLIQEPYDESFSNRDSLGFQILSRSLADGVNEVFDDIPGTQRARLVRIESRPEDIFTCKVTIELQTTGYADLDDIVLKLKSHIEQKQTLGEVTAFVDDFSYKIIKGNLKPTNSCGVNESPCASDQCFPSDKRCDGVPDCKDFSDEMGCFDEDNTERETSTSSSRIGETTKAYKEETTEPSYYPEQNTEGFPDEESTEYTTEEPTESTDRYLFTDDDYIEPTINPNICKKDEFLCDTSRCISSSSRCDNVVDCVDGSDEQTCGVRCRADDFTCDDGMCIEVDRVCNHVVDCRGGEDERNCDCLSDEFKCEDGPCIELRKKCDGVPNCLDQSDERDCSSKNVSWSGVHVCLEKGQFLCRDSSCISILLRCDGKVDCPKDNSDEADCPCTPDQWQCDFGTCIAKTKKCDGRIDCPSDRSDERYCSDRRQCMTPFWNEYFCKIDGICLPLYLRCDGKYDCDDMTDEKNCPCKETEFECSTGACILLKYKCDGITHCQNGADETGCTAKKRPCGPNQFRCDYGNCIPSKFKCDGLIDCRDGSDESSCACNKEQYSCKKSTKCIEIYQMCDSKVDCPEKDDEKLCPCDANSFVCNTGDCIPKDLVCDGTLQCPYGDDEVNCNEDAEDTCDVQCGDGICLDGSKRCNRVLDCSDGADERDCECGRGEFRCDDGRCIDQYLRCNNVADCPDSSDESDCPHVTSSPTSNCAPHEFQCASGECITNDFRCDQNSDCIDNSDEINCSNECEGDAIWCDGRCIAESYICDGVQDCSDGRDEEKSLCEKVPQCASFEYVCDDNSCVHYNLVCNGVSDCRDGSDEKDCNECSSGQWQCLSGECINGNKLCDGVSDCQDGSDEQSVSCRHVTVAPTRPTTPYTPYPTTPFTQRPTEQGGCSHNEWRCENGPCIHANLRCNGNIDCPYDSSDELDCPNSGGLKLKTYPNDQIIKQNPYPKGGDVVFQCRDEGPLRAPVKWTREGGRPLPAGSTDRSGRLEMPNVQVADGGIYICQAIGYSRYTSGSELSVRLTVEPYTKIEPRPIKSCKINEATCSNGGCIPKNQVCNGHFDCTDGSDEMACNVHGICEPNEFKCSNKRCILKTWVCDAEDDCKDGSDEENCGVSTGDECRSYEFQCKSLSKQCISRSYHCDGQNDCLDGSDEMGCSPVYISRPPPPMMILEEHSTMTITCIAHGVPSPVVVWRLNWGHIPEKCSYTSEMGIGTLTCPDIRIEDQGAYSCEALNNRGSVFAVPDTILVVNRTSPTNVCPAGYFNSEARVAQDCISCFCFGATTECSSADLFTYQLPPPLSRSGIRLTGVTQQPGQTLQITDEPISDIFDLAVADNGAISVIRMGQWSPRNIYPFIALSENYLGSQLKSYGGYIQYSIGPNSNNAAPQGYIQLPDLILKGGNILLTHKKSANDRDRQNVSVRLFQGQWQKVTSRGLQRATREDIMMVLANIEALLLRAEDNGSGVEITNFRMDTAGIDNSGQGLAAFVEECKCPQGYSGMSCQKCSPGFSRVESGNWLGRCVREEESCQPGYYGNPSAGVPCRVCPCPLTNPGNQFSRTCRLENDGQALCDCPVGYSGKRCEVCSPGFVGNPTIPGSSCRPAPPPPSRCDVRGTISQDSDICRCKPNVIGPRCNECADESFHLSLDNIFGCSQCFCMGVTRSCTSSTKRRNTISAKFASQSAIQSVKLLEWDDQPESVKTIPANQIRSNPQNQEISFRNFDRDSQSTYYWQLPDRFAGEKLTAYGGYLNYTVRALSGEDYTNSDPDIQLISNNDIVLVHYNGAKPGEDGIVSESVQILEQHWQRVDGMPAGREHILMALADLQSVLVKATYSLNTESASLISASIEVSDDRGFGERASHVEECQCPEGYLGTSCQDCAPGYTRIPEGLYLGFCSLCNCNGHSRECHPETGECMNCEHNTFGSSCEYCRPEYVGNATSGLPDACRQASPSPCSCDDRGTIEPFCVNEDYCRCKQNVEGDNCNRCQPGSFKLSKSNPQGCTSCHCSGVTDQCSEAHHLYKQEIPIGIIDDSHGFVLTNIDQTNVIDANFQLDISLNQISYDFGGRPPSERLFWSLPIAFTGNKVTSYNGQISVTQKFESYDGYEYSSDDMDVVLVGKDTIYWKNPRKLRSGASLTYSVPLTENDWQTLSSGEAPRPVSRSDFLDILSDIRLILIRATLSPSLTSSYIADVAMDFAVPGETGNPLAENIELCHCPSGYSGTSCESCSQGYYRNAVGNCERCPCSGREEACRLGPRQSVICECKPGFVGRDCSTPESSSTEESATYSPTEPSSPSIQVMISSPKIENKPEGGSVQFLCQARSIYSSAPIRVSWSKEGGSLPLGRTIEDASRGLLAIRDLKISDSGTYICQASDEISTGSDIASLTVPIFPDKVIYAPEYQLVSPQIMINPAVLEIYEGDPIEIRCHVTGTPTPSITWSKVNKRTMNPGHSFVEGIFRINSARISDQGEYRCFASNSVGRDSKVAVIHVSPRQEGQPSAPILSVNPSQPVIREGDSLTIVCSADHSIPSHFITWNRENGNLPPNFKSQNGQLWMDSVRHEDAGRYYCSADQFPSRITPATVLITVQRQAPSPPNYNISVVVETNRAIVPEGQSYTVKCEPKGYPQPIIKWTKEESDFGPGVSQRGNVLVINQARLSDRGVYVCIGSSMDDDTPIAQDYVYIDIERREVPEVLIWPEGVQTVRPGENARLQCRLMKGLPDPILTWSRPSGRPLTGNTHLLPDGILSFSAVTVNEEGTYTCTGSNVAGERSVNATIKLQSPPTLSIYPDTYISAQLGQELTLTCKAYGYPEPIIHWIQVTPIERTLTTDHAGNVSYVLSSVSEDDEGNYACVARNEAGIHEESVSITVVDNEIDTYPERGDIPGPIPPKVSIRSAKNVSLHVGDMMRIHCKTSDKIDTIYWSKVGSNRSPNMETYADGSILLLEQISAEDSGTYRCNGYDNNTGSHSFDEIIVHVIDDYPQPGSLDTRFDSSSHISSSNWHEREPDWQQEEPEVVSARLGSNVLLPCTSNLPTPITFHWIRPHAKFSKNIPDRAPTLRLMSINESDAGPYICRQTHGNLQIQSRKILKVTHIVPKFTGDGFLALNTLKDAFLYFDIEVSIKPQDYTGIILYNSGTTGDMISLSLVNGIPEFRYTLSQGSSVIIRGDKQLSLDEWHTIKISRSRKDGFMYVDERGPFTGSAKSVSVGLDLTGPLYIGGVPDINQLPDDFNPRTGFVGCIGRLLLENVDVPLMTDALEKENTDACDTCSQNRCQNNGICQESLTHRDYYTCICADGYSGVDCAGTGESCMSGICGPGHCTDTVEGFQCTCPIGYAGQRCESRIDIEYPAFSGKAYLAFPPPQTTRHLKVSMRVKPTYPMRDGLILYCAESRHGGHGDFTSLALKNGYLEFRFALGSGLAVLRSREPLSPNKWVNVTISRVNNNGSLRVEGQDLVTGIAQSRKPALVLKTPLYIGGYDSSLITVNKGAEVDGGFVGCISDVKISETQLDMKNSTLKSANIQNCGDNDSDYKPYRGDIPEGTTTYPYEYEDVCRMCQNGGYCNRPGDTECECHPGYEGTYCETIVSTESQYSPCDRQPCENGGTCRPSRQGSLYICDCPKGYRGHQCKQRVDLGTDLSLLGEGYAELPAYLLPHDNPKGSEVIALAFTTSESDGLLVYQGDGSANPKDGDFIMLSINGGYVELQWDLGGGVGTIKNTRVLVSDNQRHQVIANRTGADAILEVDMVEDHGRAPGMTTVFNADSNIYIGGVPSHLTQSGIIGFTGCIHQIEFQDSQAINLGSMALASRNANRCSKNDADDRENMLK